jgi:hypothetical protein
MEEASEIGARLLLILLIIAGAMKAAYSTHQGSSCQNHDSYTLDHRNAIAAINSERSESPSVQVGFILVSR